MARGDLGGTGLEVGGVDLSTLDWSADQRGKSLEQFIAYAHKLAVDTRDWYNLGKRDKQRAAKMLRVVAILATAVAGIFPILTQIYTTDGVPDIEPAWASVALAVAATCIGLDRFFGFSSGWLRYIEAQTKIRNAIQVFVVESIIETSRSTSLLEAGLRSFFFFAMLQFYFMQRHQMAVLQKIDPLSNYSVAPNRL